MLNSSIRCSRAAPPSFMAEGLVDTASAIAEAVHHPPPVIMSSLRDGVQVTRPWIHGAVSHHLPPMEHHVVAAYYSGSRPLQWRRGTTRIASRTGPGRINLLPRGRDGRWDIEGSVEVSHVYISEKRLESCREEMTNGRPVELLDRAGFQDATASRLQDLLSREATRGDSSNSLFVDQAIDLLCVHLLRAHSSEGAMAVLPRRGLSEKQLRRVTDYMHAHLDEEISLAEMAAQVGLSRYHLCRAFRLATGLTPYEWLTQERLREARRQLAETELPITDIALSVGYATPSAFSASFRRAFSVSPSSFRRAL